MVRHCVEGGARAAAVGVPWRDVLWPDAALAWLALGRYVADFALEGEEVDDGKGKIPEHQASKEGALVELRVCPATDAAESSDDEYHGLGQGKRDKKRRGARKRQHSIYEIYIGQPLSMVRREPPAFSAAGLFVYGATLWPFISAGSRGKRSVTLVMTNREMQDQVTVQLPVW